MHIRESTIYVNCGIVVGTRDGLRLPDSDFSDY